MQTSCQQICVLTVGKYAYWQSEDMSTDSRKMCVLTVGGYEY